MVPAAPFALPKKTPAGFTMKARRAREWLIFKKSPGRDSGTMCGVCRRRSPTFVSFGPSW